MRNVAIVVVAVLMTACASTSPYVPKTTVVDRPPTGVVTQAQIGESLVSKGRSLVVPGFVLRSQIEDSFVVLEPQTMLLRYTSAKHDYFVSTAAYQRFFGDTQPRPGVGVCVSRSHPRKVAVFVTLGLCPNEDLSPDYEIRDVTLSSSMSFQQQLIYNGRSGQTLRFIYREFSSNMARPAFTQELQYDLTEGNKIGFQQVRIEVVSATNMTISYKVLSTFSDR